MKRQKTGHKPGFGSVATREDFAEVFGTAVHVPARSEAALKSDRFLSQEAVAFFILKELAPALGLSSKIVRIRNERSRYLVIYEILKAYAKIAQGRLFLETTSLQDLLQESAKDLGREAQDDAGKSAPTSAKHK